MESKYLISGMVVQLKTIDCAEGELLHEELSVYPKSVASTCDIEINYLSELKLDDALAKNPSSNVLTLDGFGFTMGPVSVLYGFKGSDLYKVDFTIQNSSRFKSLIIKMLNIQFTNHKEAIGQWFHEHVMAPLGFLVNNMAVVHSSAVSTPDSGAILFGGTGGVGKTSLELELCTKQGCSFLSDDICLISKEGEVYPNLSFPKIYGYNLKGDQDIKKAVFKKKSLLNILFYRLHSLRGAQFVRRRISADKLYNRHVNVHQKVNSYLILTKSDVQKIEFERLSVEDALKLTQQVIFNEYNKYVNHVIWHEYNSLIAKQPPKITYSEIYRKNEEVMSSFLHQVDQLYLVKIPLEIPHSDFKENMVTELKKHQILK